MKKVSEGRTKHGIVDKNLRPINAKKKYILKGEKDYEESN